MQHENGAAFVVVTGPFPVAYHTMDGLNVCGGSPEDDISFDLLFDARPPVKRLGKLVHLNHSAVRTVHQI